MTTEKLKTLIAELLEVSDSEKNLAFLLFKKKISETLQLGEAIKIPSIGVFQLKEQLNVAKEKSASSKGKTTIVFSPIEKNDDESLFLTLEIEENYDSSEFDEKVFSIGIDKPIMPIGEDEQKKEENNYKSLDRKITDVISKSEKIENFDLWDDYLDKHAASILSEETDEMNDIDSYLHSEEIGPSEDDFMEFDEDEFLAEFESTELDDDDSDEIVTISDTEELSDVETDIVNEVEEEESIIELSEKDIEPANEILEEIPVNPDSDEQISNTDDIEEVDNLDEDESTEKLDESIFYEVNEADEKNENIEDTKPVDNTVNEENKEKILPILEEEEKIKNKAGKKMVFKKKNIMHERRYSPTIYALIAAFFIVGGIGIYYLFFNNPTWLYDQNEIEIELSEKHQREFEEAKRRARLLAQKEDSIRNANKKAEEEIANGKDTMNSVEKESVKEGTTIVAKESNTKVTNEVKTEVKKATAAPPKKEITKVQEEILNKKNTLPKKKYQRKKSQKLNMPKNVYFNGSSYSLQISSWPKKYLAEKEVNRLKQKGYDAFIVKAYIPKFKKNWYRVRIGNLSTVEEAKKIQQQIK